MIKVRSILQEDGYADDITLRRELRLPDAEYRTVIGAMCATRQLDRCASYLVPRPDPLEPQRQVA